MILNIRNIKTYVRRFGSWPGALKIAGFDENFYNPTNTCDKCREEGRTTKLYTKHAHHELDEKRDWTGRWLCSSCYGKNERKNNPNCLDNEKKSLSDRRTGNQNPNSSNVTGDNFEELTCIWRSTVSTIPVENLNIKNDNYEFPIDHSRDSELGILQTKGRSYDPTRKYWNQSLLDLCDTVQRGFEFDNLIFYCASKNREYIERIYIIPKKEIFNRTNVSIYKNTVDGWYEKYRVTDKEIIIKVNAIWQQILNR